MHSRGSLHIHTPYFDCGHNISAQESFNFYSPYNGSSNNNNNNKIHRKRLHFGSVCNVHAILVSRKKNNHCLSVRNEKRKTFYTCMQKHCEIGDAMRGPYFLSSHSHILSRVEKSTQCHYLLLNKLESASFMRVCVCVCLGYFLLCTQHEQLVRTD